MAEKCSKTFGMKYFYIMREPIETVIISPTEFYYIYPFPKQQDYERLINVKIPKAEQAIRKFYTFLIHIVGRGNLLGQRGAWQIEKVRRWIIRQLRKKVQNPRELEDFCAAIELTDKDKMLAFLSSQLFKVEIIDPDEVYTNV